MSRLASSCNAVIHQLGVTSDQLTSRGGLVLFSSCLREIALLPELGRVFGSIRRSGKGLPVADLFHQSVCFFFDGTSRHLVHFDRIKQDADYCGTIETTPDQMHAMKRFFGAFQPDRTDSDGESSRRSRMQI